MALHEARGRCSLRIHVIRIRREFYTGHGVLQYPICTAGKTAGQSEALGVFAVGPGPCRYGGRGCAWLSLRSTHQAVESRQYIYGEAGDS